MEKEISFNDLTTEEVNKSKNSMIKFLGHTMTTIDGKMYFDNEYVGDVDNVDDESAIFDPKGEGYCCLVYGPRDDKRTHMEIFKEQEAFLVSVFILMNKDNPKKVYEIIKQNLHKQTDISLCKKILNEDVSLKNNIINLFLSEAKSYSKYGINYNYYYQLCNSNSFSFKLIEEFLREKQFFEKSINNDFVAKRKNLYKKRKEKNA